jgi:hypothetical protein
MGTGVNQGQWEVFNGCNPWVGLLKLEGGANKRPLLTFTHGQ